MIDYSQLPALNAILNGTAAILILTGIYLVKTGRQRAHRAVMISAVVASSLFLISYLTYHAHIGSKHFPGQGLARTVYFSILLTHTVLAAIVVPMVLVTLTRGLKGRFDRHRPIARWTYPVWLYVSVTGVVIYVMLYRLYA
jgi:putative membrane protein